MVGHVAKLGQQFLAAFVFGQFGVKRRMPAHGKANGGQAAVALLVAILQFPPDGFQQFKAVVVPAQFDLQPMPTHSVRGVKIDTFHPSVFHVHQQAALGAGFVDVAALSVARKSDHR